MSEVKPAGEARMQKDAVWKVADLSAEALAKAEAFGKGPR